MATKIKCMHDFKVLQEHIPSNFHDSKVPLIVQCRKCGKVFERWNSKLVETPITENGEKHEN